MPLKSVLQDTVQSDLEQMVSSLEQEGLSLDFKRDYPLNWDDKAIHAFAKDAVAFANAQGGTLIFGIEEGKNAAAAKIVPFNITDTDAERRKLHQFLTDWIEPSLPGVETHAVPVTVDDFKGYVLLVRIPRSWIGPHRSRKGMQFYIRDGLKNRPLPIPEIRSQFLQSEDRRDKLRNFRTGRISNILTGQTPYPLVAGAVLAVHVVPIQATFDQVDPNILQYRGLGRPIPIIASTSPLSATTVLINFDGIAGVRTVSNGVTHGYSLIFRNGFVESTWVQSTANLSPGASPSLIGPSFEGYLKVFIEKMVEEVEHWGATGNILVMLSLIRAKSLRLIEPAGYGNTGAYKFDRDILVFPEIELDPKDLNYMKQLRSIIDMVWQAAGVEGSPYFNESGQWSHPSQYPN